MLKEKLLKIYLIIFGIINILIIAVIVPVFFGDYLMWKPRNIPNEIMIAALYACFGIFMLIISRNPMKHKTFIDFYIIYNFIHGVIMLILTKNILQMLFDGIPLIIMSIIPLLIYPWGIKNFFILSFIKNNTLVKK